MREEDNTLSLALRNLVAICSTLEVGVLAGILVGTGMVGYSAKALPEISWTLQFQAEDALFSKAMPPLMISTLLLLVLACVLSRGWSRTFFATAAVLILLVLVTTIAVELPLNRQIQAWTAGSAPSTWTVVRDRWLSFHLMRTAFGIAASACAICSLLCR